MSSDSNSSDDLNMVSAPPTATATAAHAIDGKKKATAQLQLSTDAQAKSAAHHRWPKLDQSLIIFSTR
jgi:hypothetical protein